MDSSSPINAPEVRAMRKWFFLALCISVIIHVGFYYYLSHKKVERFTASADTERLVPPAFTMKRVIIPEELLKPAATPDLKKVELPKIILQNEKPTVETLPSEVRFTPNAPAPPPAADLAKAITNEKPRVEASNIARPETNAQIEKEMDSLREEVGPKNAPKIVAGKGALPDSSMDEPGYSNIDKLLAQSGPLTGPVNPIKMQDQIGNGTQPGGALFEFDSAKLNPGTIEMLRKIGTLIGRNPRATFSIEGYTDTFGTPAYNQKLSQARAEAVKSWLVTNMKLDPAKISAKGFGSKPLIVPATGTREEQAPNRRVEIVITTPKG